MVPHDAGFGYDKYGKLIFNWDYIYPVLEKYKDNLRTFYPAYASEIETGAKRGFIAIISRKLIAGVTSCIAPEWFREC